MANCYLCSASLTEGEGIPTQCVTEVLNLFGSNSSNKVYGIRTVCEKCAAESQPTLVKWGRVFFIYFFRFLA